MEENRKSPHPAHLLALAALLTFTGCANPKPMTVIPRRYELDLRLDPSANSIAGRAVIDVTRDPSSSNPQSGPVYVELLLHPALDITATHVSGARQYGSILPTPNLPTRPNQQEQIPQPKSHYVKLTEPVDAFTLFVDFKGRLAKTADRGAPKKTAPYITPDEILLASDDWYPTPAQPGIRRVASEFTLTTNELPDMQLVASGERAPNISTLPGTLTWRSPYPIQSMSLLAGHYQVHEEIHSNKTIRLYRRPGSDYQHERILETVKQNFDQYEPIIGPYPATEYSIVETKTAMPATLPTLSLLPTANSNPSDLENTLTHQMLKTWWGSAIHVAPDDGDWSTPLATFAATYDPAIINGNDEEARRIRRNFSHNLSRSQLFEDKPLDTYGQPRGCSESLAITKGPAVFHMLADKIGHDNFWRAIRNITTNQVGRFASWNTIKDSCESTSSQDLTQFFIQWIRSPGTPAPIIEKATYNSADQLMTLTISQTDPPFTLDLPIRVRHLSGFEDLTVSVDQPQQTVTLPVTGVPVTVQLDPDYHILRKVPPQDILPTIMTTQSCTALTIVIPQKPFDAPFRPFVDDFAQSARANPVLGRIAGQVEGNALAENCALFLGNSAHDPYISAFLSAVEFPVTFTSEGFLFDGEFFAEPADAVIATAPHPGVSAGSITVIYANNQDAIPDIPTINATDHSITIFSNRSPTLTRDLETTHTIPVEGS